MSDKNGGANGGAKTDATKADATATSASDLDPAMLARIAEVRTRIQETFGKVAMAMMAVPRYRSLAIADLNHLVLEPMLRDRVAIAQPKAENAEDGSLAGIAIWASVSEEVDAKIREQIKAGAFPVRLRSDEWTSGDINWLLDVIAPNARLATSVIANFRQVVKEGDMRIHPVVTRLVEPDALKRMGASPIKAEGGEGGATS